MRFLIVNTDYPDVLNWLCTEYPLLESRSYEEQMQARVKSFFGFADFYSSNLRRLGHEAWDIYVNNEFMQKAWAKEHSVQVEELSAMSQRWLQTLKRTRRVAGRTPLRNLKPLFRPVLRSLDSSQPWFYEILSAQIKYYKPDILLNQTMANIDNNFLKEVKHHVRLLVGQIASKLPEDKDFGCYDLVVSSLPNQVDYFCQLGVSSELHRLAFEPRILNSLGNKERGVSISFVGSISLNHKTRINMLEHLCKSLDFEIWGKGFERLPQNSVIRRCHKGEAWGIEMYRILHDSMMTLNHHIDIAESYANNMRLFEATGVGTMLITDYKENLHEMFKPGKEVVAYRTPEECAELIRYYLEHDDEREAIAHAGQQRTLQEHTYYQRMQELIQIVNKYI